MRMSILALSRKKKEEKVPDQRSEESKRRKFPIKDNERIIQKSLWTRKYLNNTELSQVKKKRKKTTT